MTTLEFLALIAVAAVVGVMGQAIAGFSRTGRLVMVAIGFVGALFGTLMARVLGLPELILRDLGSRSFPLEWVFVGATLFVGLLGYLGHSRRWMRRAG